MFKNVRSLALCATAFLMFSALSLAQQTSLADLQAKLGGSWTATVEGENRARVLVIDAVAQKGEGVYIITGTFNFTDQKPFNFKNGEVQTSSGNTTVLFT